MEHATSARTNAGPNFAVAGKIVAFVNVTPVSLVFVFFVPRPLLRSLWYWTPSYTPNFVCVLGDRAIAGELPRAGHIQNGLARPLVGIGIQCAEPLVCLEVRLQVRQVHVMVALRE